MAADDLNITMDSGNEIEAAPDETGRNLSADLDEGTLFNLRVTLDSAEDGGLNAKIDGSTGEDLDLDASGVIVVQYPAIIRGSGLTVNEIKALTNVVANSMYIDTNGGMWICTRTIAQADATAWMQVNIDVDLSNIGNLANLTTSDKSSLVAAVNEVNARFTASHYNGKTLSILGDSVSSFQGYVPSGNEVWYPNGNVQNVSDTWWKKVINALGMTLKVNNSYSGSRVTTTDGTATAGVTRCTSLGTDPDVIIVFIGVNDFFGDVALGTYDGKTAVPSTTTTFLEAFGLMIYRIITQYPKAEVWIGTIALTGYLPINNNNVNISTFNDGIVRLADSFDCKVLRIDKCGLKYQNASYYTVEGYHPNKDGHSLIANYIIGEMDASVKTRYPVT